MMSIEMAQAHTRDLLDASAAAFAARDAAPYAHEPTSHAARRRARTLTARLRGR